MYRPVLGELGLARARHPEAARRRGAISLRTRGGETVKVAALPFLSHRYAVRAAEVLLHDFAEHALDYAQQVAQIVQLLTDGFTADAVNVVMAHATLLGGRRGGGEREVQTSLDYELPASMFPADRALRRARPPAPAAGDPRAVPDLLLGLAAGDRLR